MFSARTDIWDNDWGTVSGKKHLESHRHGQGFKDSGVYRRIAENEVSGAVRMSNDKRKYTLPQSNNTSIPKYIGQHKLRSGHRVTWRINTDKVFGYILQNYITPWTEPFFSSRNATRADSSFRFRWSQTAMNRPCPMTKLFDDEFKNAYLDNDFSFIEYQRKHNPSRK